MFGFSYADVAVLSAEEELQLQREEEAAKKKKRKKRLRQKRIKDLKEGRKRQEVHRTCNNGSAR